MGDWLNGQMGGKSSRAAEENGHGFKKPSRGMPSFILDSYYTLALPLSERHLFKAVRVFRPRENNK